MSHSSSGLKRHTIWVMAIASGAAAANLYYNQPLLAVMAKEFQASAHSIGFIPVLTQVGYALGLFLFVPLGDLLERRRLIVTMLVATAVALGIAALSPNLTWLIAASLLIGMTSIVAQLIVPFAAQLAAPQERGKIVGMVMSGLLIGILLARTISGVVGAKLGWQAMYWIASGSMMLLAVGMAQILPRSQPSLKIPYSKLMRSLLQLIREQPVLREASLIGALSFAAFSAFWSTLVFLLEQPPYHYGSAVAGLFGLVGVVGAIAAPVVGKLTDRHSPRLTVGIGLTISALSFLVFWLFGHQLAGLIVGVILLDLGVQATMISNQARIYSLPTDMHNRLNALFIMFYFIGGAIGSYLATYSWSRWQWSGVCAVGLSVLAIALMIHARHSLKVQQAKH